MRVRDELSLGLQRQLLISTFERIRADFLKHRILQETLEALLKQFYPRDLVPLMTFRDSGNCTPAGMSFLQLFIHEKEDDSRIVAQIMKEVITRLNLTSRRQDVLVIDLIGMIDKSGKARHPGLIHAKECLQLLLPSEMRQAA